MADQSLKKRATEIMETVDRELQQAEQSPDTLKEIDSRASGIVNTLFGIISDVDIKAAARRVEALKARHPQAAPEELAQQLIRDKCQKTGAVGAATSGAGLVPGLGTAAAVTLGVAADIGATFKYQAELVLEIAAVYDYPLTEQEKRQIVMLITGLSAGTSALTRRAGQTVAIKVGEKVAERTIRKTVLKALPVIGVVASAGTNVLSTYIIGQRADVYFRLGPEALDSWGDSLRTISGVDERKIVGWLAEGAGKVGDTVGPALDTGAQTARRGIRAYFNWVISFWKAVFQLLGWLAGFVWGLIAFIPRKIMGRVAGDR